MFFKILKHFLFILKTLLFFNFKMPNKQFLFKKVNGTNKMLYYSLSGTTCGVKNKAIKI
jgi:hypothetical protein